MTTHPLWSDEYWLLLMQLYLKKPEGLKPLYSRPMVKLALELHIPPSFLLEQMFLLRHKQSPLFALLWATYGDHPYRLDAEVNKIRKMKGFGHAQDFYDGVTVAETFEKDFQPLAADKQLLPVSLIMVLDLIAHERSLAVSTIMGHLLPYIMAGQIDRRQFISEEHEQALTAYLAQHPEETSWTAIRTAMGNEYSYDEIRLVTALTGHYHHSAKESDKQ